MDGREWGRVFGGWGHACVAIDFVKNDLYDQVEVVFGSVEVRVGEEVGVSVGPVGEFSEAVSESGVAGFDCS